MAHSESENSKPKSYKLKIIKIKEISKHTGYSNVNIYLDLFAVLRLAEKLQTEVVLSIADYAIIKIEQSLSSLVRMVLSLDAKG